MKRRTWEIKRVKKKNITETPQNRSNCQDFDPKNIDFSKLDKLSNVELETVIECYGSTKTMYSDHDELDPNKTTEKIIARAQVESSPDNSDSEWQAVSAKNTKSIAEVNSMLKECDITDIKPVKPTPPSKERCIKADNYSTYRYRNCIIKKAR